MTVLQLAFVLLDVIAFAAFVLTLSAVSVKAVIGEGPAMRRSLRARPEGRAMTPTLLDQISSRVGRSRPQTLR